MATKKKTPAQPGTDLGERAQRKWGWTKRRQGNFLAVLAETSNVRAACGAVGLTPTSAYHLRQRNTAFAEQWKEAIVTARERLESALFAHALRTVHETEGDAAVDGAGVSVVVGDRFSSADVQLALALIARHRAALEKAVPKAGAGIPPRAAVTAAETDALLRKKLDALARKLKAAA